MVSDKISHGLWNIYLQTLPKDAEKVVEIGVYNGDGLRLLREFYPKATIIGVDILPRPEGLDETFEYLQAHQDNPFIVGHLSDADVIIDDASHNAELTRKTFDLLWPSMKPGAVYYIEDGHPVLEDGSMNRLIDEITARGITTTKWVSNKPLAAIARFTKQ